MRKLSILLFLYLISLPAFNQAFERNVDDNGEIQTLFGHYDGSGIYVGFAAGYSAIDGKDGVVFNGRMAWIAGHRLGIGMSATGFINNYHFDPVISNDVNLSGGYGGFLLEPIILPTFPVHVSIPVTAGMGGVAYTRVNTNHNSREYYNDWVEDEDLFFILEPGVDLEFNMVKFFRLGLGVSYRFTSDIDLVRTAPDALEGLSYLISFKFGKF